MAKNKPKSHSDTGDKCVSRLTRSRSRQYRKACTKPQQMLKGRKPYRNEIHHILCEHAILDITPDGDPNGEKLAYIQECLCIAEWDINNQKNLIGLPLWQAYNASDGQNPVDTVCHNVGHNTADGYTQEVKDWLHNNVWNVLIDVKKEHKAGAEEIVKALDLCSDIFEDRLLERGSRGVAPGGTKISWEKRFEEENKNIWYEPFSMSANPRLRSPGGQIRIFKLLNKLMP